MVKLGTKSVHGNSSSKKLNADPKAPFQPPKVRKKMRAEIGAQIKSPNSPRKGNA